MWEQVNRILRQAGGQIVGYTVDFLPGVLVSLTVILVAFIVALVVRVLVVRGLRGLDFDRRAQQVGLAAFTMWPASASPSLTVARVAYWTILILGFLASLTALNATIPSQLALSVFAYVPRLLAALLILVAGILVARFLARSVLIGAVNMQIGSARLLSLAVKWVILLVTPAMALDQLGIGQRIVPLAFGILFGGVVLAASLALGLGAKDAVSRTIERQLREGGRPEEDKLDHV